jgi:hypothetical protein
LPPEEWNSLLCFGQHRRNRLTKAINASASAGNGDPFIGTSSRCVQALFLPYTIDNAPVWKIDKRNFEASWIYPHADKIWLERLRFIQIHTRFG